jgi:AraC-like DNA-binding protein
MAVKMTAALNPTNQKITLDLANGFRLQKTCCPAPRKRIFPLRTLPDTVEFSFIKEAHIDLFFQDNKNNLTIGPMQSHLVFNGGLGGEGICFTDHPHLWLNIYVPKTFFTGMGFNFSESAALRCFRRIGRADTDTYFCHIGDLTKKMAVVYDQIFHCATNTVEQQLYIQAKCMELVVLKILQLGDIGISLGTHPLSINSESEKQLARRAAAILLSDLKNPPSLPDLAKAVGVSVSKLKKLFPKYYETTPYEFLRRQRLSYAKKLIRNNGFDASEAAYTVGYSELSPFHRAFVKEFGFRPGECKPGRLQYDAA